MQKPTITVTWDPETQSVDLSFDDKQFRTWNFVEAILRLGHDLAAHRHKVALTQQMQAQMLAQQQESAVRRSIINGR